MSCCSSLRRSTGRNDPKPVTRDQCGGENAQPGELPRRRARWTLVVGISLVIGPWALVISSIHITQIPLVPLQVRHVSSGFIGGFPAGGLDHLVKRGINILGHA